MVEPSFSIATLRRRRACSLLGRIADLATHLGRMPDDDEPIAVAVWWSLPSTNTPDRWWSLRCFPEGRAIGVRAACLAARRVLHITRDDRAVCLAAIETAEACVTDPTSTRAAAAYAAAAARAARAARGATVNAADVDAYAAHAAHAAADAAAAHAAADYADDAAADYADDAAAHAAAARADYADDVAAAYAAEREAQRADLDRLLGEVSRG